MAILAEPGPDMPVFRSARHCAARAGLCPGSNESAGKRRSGRTRRGNPTLSAIHAMPRDGKACADPGIDCGKVAVGRKFARRLRKLLECGCVVRIERERRHDTRVA